MTGTTEGRYGLIVYDVNGNTIDQFIANLVPTATSSVHTYEIDWNTLDEGVRGVTLEIDSDGDGIFEKVVTADSTLTAEEFALQTDTIVDFVPDTLNLQSKGKVVTAYIELPSGFDVSDIDVSSIRLNGTVLALTKPVSVADYDSDGTADLMMKFDGAAVRGLLVVGYSEAISISGKVLYAGEYLDFLGTDFLKLVR